MSHNDFARESNEAAWGYAFGQRLRVLLDQRNIKIAQFARQIGLPKSTLDKYLKGTSIPNYFRIVLIAE